MTISEDQYLFKILLSNCKQSITSAFFTFSVKYYCVIHSSIIPLFNTTGNSQGLTLVIFLILLFINEEIQIFKGGSLCRLIRDLF